MMVTVTFFDDKGRVIHSNKTTGGHDVLSSVRMIMGRASFEMNKIVDQSWTNAEIKIDRWAVCDTQGDENV